MTFDLFPEYFDNNRPTVSKVWYRPVDIHIRTNTHTHTDRHTHTHQLFNSIACEIKDRQTHKRQHYNNLALLMDIEFSIDKLMCKWRDMELYIKISCSKFWSVRIVLCFVVFIIQNRYCTQYKSRSILLKPWFAVADLRGGGGGQDPPTSHGSAPHLQGPYLPGPCSSQM